MASPAPSHVNARQLELMTRSLTWELRAKGSQGVGTASPGSFKRHLHCFMERRMHFPRPSSGCRAPKAHLLASPRGAERRWLPLTHLNTLPDGSTRGGGREPGVP